MKRASWCWLALVVIGCGSGMGSGGGGGTVGPSSSPPSGSAMVTVGANGSTSFDPQMVSITPGSTVTWRWLGGPHTVTSGTPGAADGKFCSLPSGTPSPSSCATTSYAQSSGTYSHTFSAAGTYPYFCEIHGSMMTGTVVVTSGGGGSGGSGGSGGGGSGGSGGGY